MNKTWFIFLFYPLFLWAAEPVSLEEAILSTQQDVRQSSLDLNALRDEIREERVPMAENLSSLQKRAALLRQQVKQVRTAQELRQNERLNLQKEVQQLQQEQEFIESVVEEYRRSMTTRLHAAEMVHVQAPLDQNPQELFAFLREWYPRRTGGYSFPGTLLDQEGREQSGEFYLFGPIGYFVNPEMGGWVVSRPNSFLPGLYDFEQSSIHSRLLDLSRGEEAELPVDVSEGDALKVREAQSSIVEHIKQGGVMVIPLLILGIVATILAVRKAFDLNRLVVKMDAETRSDIRSLNAQTESQVLKKLEHVSQPLSSLLIAGVQHRKASREHLEEILHEHVLAVVPRLEHSLGLLAVFGGVAPLLGLLGTVTGMIHTFQLVTIFGSGNAKTLSGGISEALVTTEIGLIIAIPILLVHAFLARKAKNLLGELEQTGVSLTNLIKSPVSVPE